MILDGRKTQTFRRTKRCNVGDTMQLYTGQRTKNCELIRHVTCTEVEPGIIDRVRVLIGEDEFFCNPNDFEGDRLALFAHADGFIDHNQMLQFFEGQGRKFPFHGWLHRWENG